MAEVMPFHRIWSLDSVVRVHALALQHAGVDSLALHPIDEGLHQNVLPRIAVDGRDVQKTLAVNELSYRNSYSPVWDGQSRKDRGITEMMSGERL